MSNTLAKQSSKNKHSNCFHIDWRSQDFHIVLPSRDKNTQKAVIHRACFTRERRPADRQELNSLAKFRGVKCTTKPCRKHCRRNCFRQLMRASCELSELPWVHFLQSSITGIAPSKVKKWKSMCIDVIALTRTLVLATHRALHRLAPASLPR